MRDGGFDLGLAMDGDADRIAIVDESGHYISINDVLLLLYWYMHEIREERGAWNETSRPRTCWTGLLAGSVNRRTKFPW